MPTIEGKAEAVAQKLSKLSTICDTGFALAAHIRYTRPALLYQTYKPEWADHYSEMGYMLTDPTVHWGLANVGSKNWAELEGQDPEGVIKAARQFGLDNGWTYAAGPATSRSIGSMTRSTPFTDTQRQTIRAIIDDVHDLTDGFESFPAALQDRLRALG